MKKNILIPFTLVFFFSNFRCVGQTSSEIRQMGESQISSIRVGQGINNARNAQITNSIGYLTTALSLLKSQGDHWSSLEALNKGACIPDFDMNTKDLIPSACIEVSSGGCYDCYQKAVGNLNGLRQKMGRLKCVLLNTDNFVSKSVSFGDDMSGMHALWGIAWQKERKGILESKEQLHQSYDKKYKEFMEAFEKALKEIGECEKQYADEDEWYRKYGLLYFQFLKEGYKRKE